VQSPLSLPDFAYVTGITHLDFVVCEIYLFMFPLIVTSPVFLF